MRRRLRKKTRDERTQTAAQRGDSAVSQPLAWSELTTAMAMCISVTTYQRMKRMGCPPLFFEVLMCLQACGAVADQGLVMFEMFCGVAAISRAFADSGLPAMGYDYLKDPLMNDILAPAGFLHAVTMVLALDPTAGFLWLATVCSSWVWMSHGSTGRCVAFPLGMPCASVNDANTMVARCSLLILLCIAKGCIWALEQPPSSLMALHPAMQWLRSLAGTMPNAVVVPWFLLVA